MKCSIAVLHFFYAIYPEFIPATEIKPVVLSKTKRVETKNPAQLVTGSYGGLT